MNERTNEQLNKQNYSSTGIQVLQTVHVNVCAGYMNLTCCSSCFGKLLHAFTTHMGVVT